MYLKIVCLNQLNWNNFYLLPLLLLLLPLNKNSFSNIVGFCVYTINKIIHGCLKIWNFSSCVQRDISLVRKLTREISRWTLEEKFHISSSPCIILYLLYGKQFSSLNRVSWLVSFPSGFYSTDHYHGNGPFWIIFFRAPAPAKFKLRKRKKIKKVVQNKWTR